MENQIKAKIVKKKEIVLSYIYLSEKAVLGKLNNPHAKKNGNGHAVPYWVYEDAKYPD